MDAEVFDRGGRCGVATRQAAPRLLAVVGAAAVHAAALGVLVQVFQARLLPARREIAMEVVPAPEPGPATRLLAGAVLPPQGTIVTAEPDPVPTLTRRPAVEAVRGGQRAAAAPALPPAYRPAGVVAGPPPPASVPLRDDRNSLALWEERIRRAVQDAAVYPEQARLLHREGSAQVSFDYDQGSVAAVAVAQSSHVGALDRAALAAVARAAIPGPPAALGVQRRRMLVWVAFTLG